MPRRIRSLWSTGIRVSTVLAFSAVAFLIANAPHALAKHSAEQIAKWIEQLDDDDYAVRERAGKSLLAAGVDAVDPLAEAATKASAETSWRCAETLSLLALEGDEATLTKVIEAAHRGAAKGHQGLKRLSDTLNQQRALLLHQRAVATLRKHGADVFDPLSGDPRGGMGGGFAVIGGVVIGAPLVEVEEELPRLEPGEEIEPELDEAPRLDPGALDEPREDASDDKTPAAEADDEPADMVPDLRELKAEGIEAEADDDGDVDLPRMGIDVDFDDDGAIIEDLGFDVEVPEDDADVLDPFGGVYQRQTSLTLSQNWHGTAETLRAAKHLLHFANATIVAANVDDAAIAELASSKTLRQLNIERCPTLTGKCLTSLAKTPALLKLELHGITATTEELRAFRKARPNVHLFCKGPAVMGVMADMTGPCVLSQVQANTGAAEAGLRQGDRIERIDDQLVSTFSDLTVEVFNHKSGDKIEIGYVTAEGQLRTATVKLRPREEQGRVPVPFPPR